MAQLDGLDEYDSYYNHALHEANKLTMAFARDKKSKVWTEEQLDTLMMMAQMISDIGNALYKVVDANRK